MKSYKIIIYTLLIIGAFPLFINYNFIINFLINSVYGTEPRLYVFGSICRNPNNGVIPTFHLSYLLFAILKLLVLWLLYYWRNKHFAIQATFLVMLVYSLLSVFSYYFDAFTGCYLSVYFFSEVRLFFLFRYDPAYTFLYLFTIFYMLYKVIRQIPFKELLMACLIGIISIVGWVAAYKSLYVSKCKIRAAHSTTQSTSAYSAKHVAWHSGLQHML